MRYILTLIITLLSINCFSQKTIYTALPPMEVKFVNKVGLDSIFNFGLSQTHLDSLKSLFDTAKNQATRINAANISISATNAQLIITNNNLSATGATVANHGLQITAVSNVASSAQVSSTINAVRTDSIVANWPSGGTPTIPVSMNVLNSQTIPSTFNHNGDIWISCQSCTVTFPVATKDYHWRIHNISGTKITLKFVTTLSTINTVGNIGAGSRPLDITYILATKCELH